MDVPRRIMASVFLANTLGNLKKSVEFFMALQQCTSLTV